MLSKFKKLVAILFVSILTLSIPSTSFAIEKLHFLIGGGAGGGWDGTARGTGEALIKAGFLKSASFENMSGGGGGKALSFLINTKPENTILVQSTPLVLRSITRHKGYVKGDGVLSYKDVVPIAGVIGDYGAIAVAKNSPYKTFGDVVAAYKKNPSSIKMAGGSVRGSMDHLIGALAFQEAGADPNKVVYVPYDTGGKALAGLLSGETQILSTGLGEVMSARDQVNIIGITAPERVSDAPEVPTLKEQGFDVQFVNWRGFFGPPGMSLNMKDEIAKMLGDVQKTPEWEAVRKRNAWVNIYNPGSKFVAFLERQTIEMASLFNKLGVGTPGYTLIAKKEPKKKEKKVVKKEKKKEKKKVAKVVEQEQEEFKPENKDIDNDPPRIEIAEAITVVSQSYTIKGTVRDKSKPIYLEINGRPVEVKNGKFELERFNIDPDVVEELKIVAIDQWNNRSEKIVKVTVEIKDTQMVKSYEELKPNKVKVLEDKNKIAIIIGIEKYVNLANLDAPFANRDAKAFGEYATRALGVKSSNIKLLVDDKAGRPQILEAFKLWLPRIAADGGKDIYIFFSGHGLASDDGNDLYILPQNGNSLLLEDTAITRVKLISLIQKVNPKSVTMFFDTCYSGQTREERMLVAGLKPIRIVAEEQDTPDNFTIFSASNFDQTSGTIKEAKQGMFSYYLMKGLEGKADENKDKQITNGEMITYLKTNVSKEAFTQNREQDPMLSGDPEQILMRY